MTLKRFKSPYSCVIPPLTLPQGAKKNKRERERESEFKIGTNKMAEKQATSLDHFRSIFSYHIKQPRLKKFGFRNDQTTNPTPPTT